MRNYGTGYNQDGSLFAPTYKGNWADGADPSNRMNPTDAQARVGINPLDTYSSKWMNAFENFNSSNINQAVLCFKDFYDEFKTVLSHAGITPSRFDTEQFYKSIIEILTNFDLSNHVITFTVPSPSIFRQISSGSTLTQLFSDLTGWYVKITQIAASISTLNDTLDAEIERAKAAENALETRIDDEHTTRENAITALHTRNLNLANRLRVISSDLGNLLYTRIDNIQNRRSNIYTRWYIQDNLFMYGPDNNSVVYSGADGKWSIKADWVGQFAQGRTPYVINIIFNGYYPGSSILYPYNSYCFNFEIGIGLDFYHRLVNEGKITPENGWFNFYLNFSQLKELMNRYRLNDVLYPASGMLRRRDYLENYSYGKDCHVYAVTTSPGQADIFVMAAVPHETSLTSIFKYVVYPMERTSLGNFIQCNVRSIM